MKEGALLFKRPRKDTDRLPVQKRRLLSSDTDLHLVPEKELPSIDTDRRPAQKKELPKDGTDRLLVQEKELPNDDMDLRLIPKKNLTQQDVDPHLVPDLQALVTIDTDLAQEVTLLLGIRRETGQETDTQKDIDRLLKGARTTADDPLREKLANIATRDIDINNKNKNKSLLYYSSVKYSSSSV